MEPDSSAAGRSRCRGAPCRSRRRAARSPGGGCAAIRAPPSRRARAQAAGTARAPRPPAAQGRAPRKARAADPSGTPCRKAGASRRPTAGQPNERPACCREGFSSCVQCTIAPPAGQATAAQPRARGARKPFDITGIPRGSNADHPRIQRRFHVDHLRIQRRSNANSTCHNTW